MRWIPALQNQLACLIDVGRSEAHLRVRCSLRIEPSSVGNNILPQLP